MTFVRRFTIILGALCLSAMVVLTCVDVALRYFTNSPIFGSSEMVRVMLGICVFAGMFAVTRDRGHVNVSLFEPFLLRYFRGVYRTLFDGATLLGVLAVTAILLWKVWDLTHYPDYSVVLRIPMIWVVSIMAGLSALSIVAAIIAMRSPTPQDTPHAPKNLDYE